MVLDRHVKLGVFCYVSSTWTQLRDLHAHPWPCPSHGTDRLPLPRQLTMSSSCRRWWTCSPWATCTAGRWGWNWPIPSEVTGGGQHVGQTDTHSFLRKLAKNMLIYLVGDQYQYRYASQHGGEQLWQGQKWDYCSLPSPRCHRPHGWKAPCRRKLTSRELPPTPGTWTRTGSAIQSFLQEKTGFNTQTGEKKKM